MDATWLQEMGSFLTWVEPRVHASIHVPLLLSKLDTLIQFASCDLNADGMLSRSEFERLREQSVLSEGSPVLQAMAYASVSPRIPGRPNVNEHNRDPSPTPNQDLPQRESMSSEVEDREGAEGGTAIRHVSFVLPTTPGGPSTLSVKRALEKIEHDVKAMRHSPAKNFLPQAQRGDLDKTSAAPLDSTITISNSSPHFARQQQTNPVTKMMTLQSETLRREEAASTALDQAKKIALLESQLADIQSKQKGMKNIASCEFILEGVPDVSTYLLPRTQLYCMFGCAYLPAGENGVAAGGVVPSQTQRILDLEEEVAGLTARLKAEEVARCDSPMLFHYRHACTRTIVSYP